MRNQSTEFTAITIDKKWNVIGDNAIETACYPSTQCMGTNKLMHNGKIGFLMVFRYIHVRSPLIPF